MITVRYSANCGSSYQVFKDSELIGHVRIKRSMTSDKYLAVIQGEGEEDCSAKEFDTPYDAMYWLEKRREKGKGS
ncbi:MAG: hypothetical protein ABSA71_06420 [Desulfomonilia bacterium]|jgi:hypothetical protein